MLKTTRKIIDTLDWIKDRLRNESPVVESLRKEIERLQIQNETLFGKLMARSWEEYRIYSPVEQDDKRLVQFLDGLSPDQDEEFAGEIMEVNDDTR